MNQLKKNNDKPDNFLFIIGAMKSGTTTLFDILSQHPEICAAKDKEPDFFTKEITEKKFEDYLKLYEWKPELQKVAMEASVSYAKHPIVKNVPKRIKDSNISNAKFVYVLRQPLKRIESQVRHGVFAGWGQGLDTGIPEDAVYFSDYTMQISHYLESFERSNLLVITLEAFKEDPEIELKKICQHIGVDDSFLFQDVNKTKNSGDFFNTPPFISFITQNRVSNYLKSFLPRKWIDYLRENITVLFKRKEQSSPRTDRWQLNELEKCQILKRLDCSLIALERDFDVNIDRYWPELREGRQQ